MRRLFLCPRKHDCAAFDGWWERAYHFGMNGPTRQEISAQKEAIDARVDGKLAVLEQKMDTGFAAAHAKMDAGFAAAHAKMDTGFAAVHAKMDTGLAALHAKIDAGLAEVRAELIKWMVGLTLGTVAAGVTVMTFVLNYAVAHAPPQPGPAPIVIYLPAQGGAPAPQSAPAAPPARLP
jgi:hypothetical protein